MQHKSQRGSLVAQLNKNIFQVSQFDISEVSLLYFQLDYDLA
jgi:hypothetical protein